ncbi:alginate export family protein, partial [Bacteroidota bacterium]
EVRKIHEFRPLNTLPPQYFFSQRSRFNIDLKKDELRGRLGIQDVRAWSEPEVYNNYTGLFFSELWFQFSPFDLVHFTLGRQAIKYDGQRLISITNWNQTGTFHDLVLLQYHKAGKKLDAGFSYRIDKLYQFFKKPCPECDYKALMFFWFENKISNEFKYSVINITDGKEAIDSDKVLYRNTSGPRLFLKKDVFTFAGNAYYQFGRNPEDLPVRAFMFTIRIQAEVFENQQFHSGLGYYSGNNELDTVQTSENEFDQLYSSNHGFLGYIDFFKKEKKGGLINYYLQWANKLGKKVNTEISGHAFWLSNNIPHPDYSIEDQIAASRFLGSEVDIQIQYALNQNLELQFNYSLFSATKSFQSVNTWSTDALTHWVSLMLTYDFYR